MSVTLPWLVPGGKPHTARLLFTGAAGGAWNRNTFNDVWRRSLKKAKIPVCRQNGCHVLRHTSASAWLANGVDLRTVADYLGHTDPAFTLRIYAHLVPDHADRARKAMDVFFAGADGEASAPGVPSGGAR